MHYRLEVEPDCISIKHVETDYEVGYTFYGKAVCTAGSQYGYSKTYYDEGRKVEFFPGDFGGVHPLIYAPTRTALYREEYNSPALPVGKWNGQADRVERQLGTLIADTALAFVRGYFETTGTGLTPETRDEFATSLAELASIWWVSRIGCFDLINGGIEPYFANQSPSGPRLKFPGAAQAYGLQELRVRHPNLTDPELQKVLGWVLRWLRDAIIADKAQQERDTAAFLQNAWGRP